MHNDEGSAMTGGAADDPYTWVRCPGCGRGLWRRYADRIEMKMRPRGHQHRVVRKFLPLDATLHVQCEHCRAWWKGDSQDTLHREDVDG